MAAVAVERRGDRVFHRPGRAQPSVRQLLHRRQHIVQTIGAAHRHPAGAPAGREVRLRERGERNHRRVGVGLGDRRQRAIESNVGVDLVGKERHVVRLGDVYERPAYRWRIDGARRVVRIDRDEGSCLRVDQAANVIEVRQPAVRRIRTVEDRYARSWPGLRCRAGRSAPARGPRRLLRRARSGPARFLRRSRMSARPGRPTAACRGARTRQRPPLARWRFRPTARNRCARRESPARRPRRDVAASGSRRGSDPRC